MKQKFLVVVVILLLVSCGGKDNRTTTSFEETLSGVWKLNVGKPEKINLLSELHIVPKAEAIRKMENVSLPISRDDIEIKFIDGKTYIRIPLEKEEKIFGLGLNFKTVEQRKRIFRFVARLRSLD